jgi:type IV pilus assembly protein PilB
MAPRLGEILVEDYRLLPADIDAALRAKRPGERIGEILVRMGLLSERDLVTALGQQLRIPVLVGLPRREVPEEILALVPLRTAERKLILPVAIEPPKTLVVAMADPTDAKTIAMLQGLCGFTVQPAIAPEEEIRRALKVFYFQETAHRDPQEITDSFEALRSRLHDPTSVSSLGSMVGPGATKSSSVSVGASVPEDDPVHTGSTVGS